jgi:hypothetical protein
MSEAIVEGRARSSKLSFTHVIIARPTLLTSCRSSLRPRPGASSVTHCDAYEA